MKRIPFWLSIILLVALSACSSTAQNAEQAASVYIENKGSDTIVNLALAWAEAYQPQHPDVRISVTGGGSGTGIAALLNGTVDIANASRAIKPEEIKEAESKGIEPVEYVVARDAIAVIVNPQNPVNQLTLQQISDIYSGKLNNWKELGGEDRPIVRLSRETNSGTHVFFLETVIRLGKKDNKTIFSADTLLLPSSEGIISEVRDNPNAIGYDGLGYITAETKMLKVARKEGDDFVLPSVETVNNNAYPIARDLYMYAPASANQAVRDYLDWIILPEAQKIVTQLGFVPIIVKP